MMDDGETPGFLCKISLAFQDKASTKGLNKVIKYAKEIIIVVFVMT